jgi:hypothetical protein
MLFRHVSHCSLKSLSIRLLLIFAATASAAATQGDVIVLANRTGAQLPVRFQPSAGTAQQLTLPIGAVVPMFLDGQAHVEFASPGSPKRYELDANCAYFFGRSGRGGVDMQKIGLGEEAGTARGRKLPGSALRAPSATITVKIFVDEEEPARQVHWERRLRARVDAASAILEQYCRVGLRVVSVGRWNSDNDTQSPESFPARTLAHPDAGRGILRRKARGFVWLRPMPWEDD